MNDASLEFNTRLELDVLLNGLTEVDHEYVSLFKWSRLDEIVIPDGVKKLGDWTFHQCGGITDITISDSVTNIGYSAFAHCYNLTSIVIPDNVVSIGEFAFKSCHRLKSVIIPASVVYIGHWAFDDCDNLKDVIFKDRTFAEISSIDGYPWDFCCSGQFIVQDD